MSLREFGPDPVSSCSRRFCFVLVSLKKIDPSPVFNCFRKFRKIAPEVLTNIEREMRNGWINSIARCDPKRQHPVKHSLVPFDIFARWAVLSCHVFDIVIYLGIAWPNQA